MSLHVLAQGVVQTAYDDETHEYLLVKGNPNSDDYEVLGSVGRLGNRVTEDGHTSVAYDGSEPAAGILQAATDAHAHVLTVPRQTYWMCVTGGSAAFMLSLDGGGGDSMAFGPNTNVVLPLAINKGTQIYARAYAAGGVANNIAVTVW